jgi:iron(III) transport system permease protein
MRRLDAWDGVAGLGFLLLGALLVLPLGKLLVASVITPEGHLTLRPYAEFLGRPYYSRTIGHSFLVSGLVTAASLMIAAPLAWIVARIAVPGAFLLRTLAILPLVSPPFIGAYSWVLLLGRAGYVTQGFQAWGIRLPTVYGMHGIVLALTLNLYPLAFLVLLSGLRTMDHSLEEAAAGLSARRARVFRTVTAPVLLPSVLGGAVLVFLTAFADFGAPMIIGEGY